jgi:hypothetical protein
MSVTLPFGYEAAVAVVCLVCCLLAVVAAVRHKLGWVTGGVMAALSCAGGLVNAFM